MDLLESPTAPDARPVDARWGRRDLATAERAWPVAKRGVDLVVATVALVVTAPVLLLAALLVRLDSPGPVLFRQERIGRHGRRFQVLKLRTMRHGAPQDVHREFIGRLVGAGELGTGLQKLTDDPRVTRVGRTLRRWSIDELPQLINVLRGEMSLVGPRPALDYELEHYNPEHHDRFLVRPGLTGLWQVSGRNDLHFVAMLDLDVEYARRQGALLDARILVRTPMAVVRRRAA